MGQLWEGRENEGQTFADWGGAVCGLLAWQESLFRRTIELRLDFAAQL